APEPSHAITRPPPTLEPRADQDFGRTQRERIGHFAPTAQARAVEPAGEAGGPDRFARPFHGRSAQAKTPEAADGDARKPIGEQRDQRDLGRIDRDGLSIGPDAEPVRHREEGPTAWCPAIPTVPECQGSPLAEEAKTSPPRWLL